MNAKDVQNDYYIDISSRSLIIDYENHFHLKHLKTALKESKEVNLNTSVHYNVDDGLYKAFEKNEIKVNIIIGQPDEILGCIKRKYFRYSNCLS